MKVSVIIPTLNEAKNIGKLLGFLRQNSAPELAEILVVDAGSTDNTAEVVRAAGGTLLSPGVRGRARQMNFGASAAKGDVLYFVHADTLPPATYLEDIRRAREEGFPLGSYQSAYDTRSLLLKINAFFTRFDFLWCRGGDQTLFVDRPVFEALNGYREDYCIMEEYDFIVRARREHPFKIMDKAALISARKYEENSYMRVQLANLVVFNMYRLGYSQERLANTYTKLLKYR